MVAALLEFVEEGERSFWDTWGLPPLLHFMVCMLGIAGCFVFWLLSRRGPRTALLTPFLLVGVAWPFLCYSVEAKVEGWTLSPMMVMLWAGMDAASGDLPDWVDWQRIRVLTSVCLGLASGLFYLWGRRRFDDLVGRGP